MALGKKNLVVETMDLTKIFRDFWGHQRVIAVKDLNLEIHPREIFGLLGPNGSGKSTTLKMLLGLLYPTRGWARVLGRLPGDIQTNARIGYLPEESYLYPFLNARETLDFYGRLFGLTRSERRRRIDSLLEMVGLASITRRPVGEYSKGMIRRIGLAQALINDPDLLILDEPTSGLDPIGTRQIKDLISELGRRGKTVLLCSHLLADVEDVCDRICILYGGRIHSEGTVDVMLTCSQSTQITSPALSDESVSKIERIIRAEYPDEEDLIVVTNPRDKLEDVFLRIVSEAQAAELETSGAVIGTGVSDFLTSAVPAEETSRAVIEQLVSPRQQVKAVSVEEDSVATTAEGPLESQQVRQEVLESLVSTAQVDSTEEDKAEDKTAPDLIPPGESGDSETPAPDRAKVDHSVIDDLLNKKKE